VFRCGGLDENTTRVRLRGASSGDRHSPWPNLGGPEAVSAHLYATLLRISGAIQVLEELLAAGGQADEANQGEASTDEANRNL
jgi:hypothetical protein